MKDIIIKIQNLINEGYIKQAHNQLAPLLMKRPNEFNLLQLQFMIHMSNKDDIKSLELLYKMAEVKKHEAIYNNIANLEKKKNNFEVAVQYYLKAIKINNNNAEIYVNFGDCVAKIYAKNINLDENIKLEDPIYYYNKALEINPDYYNALNNLAVEYLKLEDKQKSKNVIEKALKINPTGIEAIINYTMNSILLDQIDDAISVLSSAYSKGISNEKITFYLVILNSYLGNNTDLDNLLSTLDKKSTLFLSLDAWNFLHEKRNSKFTLTLDRSQLIKTGLSLTNSNQSGLFFEFGVAYGNSINFIAKNISNKIHGFDSFHGLHEDWNGLTKGTFSSKGVIPEVEDNVVIHQGMFEETLPVFLKNNNENISFVHIDCDLYSSTKTILDNIGSRLSQGSILLFDEMVGFEGFEKSEFKAFNEFVSNNNINFECQAINYLTGQVLIKIIN